MTGTMQRRPSGVRSDRPQHRKRIEPLAFMAPRPPTARELRQASPQRRSAWLLILSALCVVILIAMLARLQLVVPHRYVVKGVGQRQVRDELLGLRGSIVDRHGESLAMSLPAVAVVADPRYVKNAESEATKLAGVLGVGAAQIRAALERPDTGFAYVARQLDPETGAQVRALGLPGVHVVDETRRVNAADDLAMSVVGRMDGFGEQPLFGLERSLDRLLRGTNGMKVYERGSDGATIVGSERIEKAPDGGSDVSLTIDRSLQYVAESALEEQVARTGAAGGTAIIGRPSTGEILAMASVMTANGEARPAKLNLAVRTYEPGSVMKIVTASAGFETGAVTLDQTLTVPPSIKVADKVVHDSHRHPTELMTVERILAESSNVGTIKIAQLVGRQTILDTLDRFGFGKMTNLGLYREQSGQFRRKWYGSDIGSIPIGQSITATPLQIWSAYNTIANGGMYVAPRLVNKWTDAAGRSGHPQVPASRRVVSESTARSVTQALEKVVEEGTGKEWSIPGYSIAAKTGTAYEPVGGGVKGYGSPGNRHYAASFAGFFPASNPQLSIIVMIDDPAYGLHFGSEAAGPVFDRLAKEGMRRYGIAGDLAEPTRTGPMRAQPAVATTTTTTTIPAEVTVADPDAAPDAALAALPEPAAGGDG